MKKIKVAILGATGMVGQRLVSLLADHAWFDLSLLAASSQSAGKTYIQAVKNRWQLICPIPAQVRRMKVFNVVKDLRPISQRVDLVFSALNMDKEVIKKIEIDYAQVGMAVISNNSAHRWTSDIPMIIPEVNPQHLNLIKIQQKNRAWSKGFIVTKPNCSLQTFVPPITALQKFGPGKIIVSTYQAISGAGKTFSTWPAMKDNVIPLIKGEEDKTEKEPLKIWGNIKNQKLIPAYQPKISSTCIRVPVSDGHMAAIEVKFKNPPSKEQILRSWCNFNPLERLNLPSAPKYFLKYFQQEDRPQTKLDRNLGQGMTISLGGLRQGRIFDWRFVCLSHNTLRGAAGGSVLTAELLYKKGYLNY